jgi:pilus assembly protein CpaF
VVQTTRLTGGARKLTQISEITGTANDTISMHDLFVFEQTGLDERRSARGHFAATGIRPYCLDRLRAAGIDLSSDLFERRTLVIDRLDDLEPTSCRP